MTTSVRSIFLIAMSLLMIRLYYKWTSPSPGSACVPQPRYYANGSLIQNPVRYLIDTCVDEDQCFGWGDRQRAIVTTYLISLLSDRQFGIYMSNPCLLENFLAPNKLCTRNFYMYNDHLENGRQHQMIEKADFRTHVKNHTLVCAHVRMGIEGIDFLRTPKSDLQVIWDFLRRYNDINKYKIYVATDLNETKAQAKKLFRDQIFDTVGIIDQMHRSKSCEVFRRVIVEQEILTRCDILILTESTLGMIAAFTRNRNNGLYCFYKQRVFPCRIETLHELHNIM
ncbi:hypothetical protein ACJMK2_012731 [Sinanodonta woodiana]|uniref:L-Fucosyltransferase n=1 Tax=Sinanodonta woodiana TaxID=1069815 RepID=A0ABD3V9F7_SINWO